MIVKSVERSSIRGGCWTATVLSTREFRTLLVEFAGVDSVCKPLPLGTLKMFTKMSPSWALKTTMSSTMEWQVSNND